MDYNNRVTIDGETALIQIAGELVDVAALGGNILANPGNVTGIFLFIPLAIWVCHVCVRGSFMDGRGLAACILGGVLGHMLLFSIYIVNLMLGHLAAALWVPFAVSSPIWVSWLLCKAFKSKTTEMTAKLLQSSKKS